MKCDVKSVSRLILIGMFTAVIFVLQTGCGSDQNNANAEGGFGYENVKISSVYKGCTAGDDGCTYYTVDFPELKGFAGADQINDFIMSEFLEADSKDQLRHDADSFIALYEKTYRDDPEEQVPWYYFSQTDVQMLYDSVVQVHMGLNEYTGGAHANFGDYYRNFSLNGKHLDYAHFLGGMSPDELNNELMRVFAAQFDDSENLLLEETIQPTDNFFPVDNGVVFVYNPYDIAPFSAGVIKLRVLRK